MVTKNIPLKNTKGVLYYSPVGSSEYAEAGKRIVSELLKQNVPVSWQQFVLDSTSNDETDFVFQEAKKSINKNIDFDTAIFQCSPDVWFKYTERFKIKFLKKKLIGYPIWETNKVSDLWVKYMNLMNEIWVPSNFNKEVFEKCGVEVPIKVVPFPFVQRPLPDINSDSLTYLLSKSKWFGNESKSFQYGSDWKIFYTTGEWNDKTNIEETVKVFCKTFTIEDRVKLIIKTFYKDHSKKNESFCVSRITSILSEFKNYPEILLITSELSVQDNLLLHSIGDCFYSLSSGEGFCLDAFDSVSYKKDVVMPNFGGHLDYLGKNYSGLVDCDLVNVGFKERQETYSGDQKWCESNPNDAMDKLKDVYLKFPPKQSDSQVVLNRGWYFKERRNGIAFRQSSKNANILFKDQSQDYVKLKVRYDIGEPQKDLVVLMDSTIKKKFVLSKGEDQDILIPIRGVKNIELSTSSDISEKNIGITLKHITLIKNNCITILNIDELCVEDELSYLYYFSAEQKIAEDINKEVISLGEFKKSKTSLVKIEVLNDEEFKGITYFGQYGTSGYATAAKGNLVHFFTKGIPISWIPLYFDNSQLSDECFYNAMVKSLIRKPIEKYDTVFLHSTPDTWSDLKTKNANMLKDKKTIGYTVWESSQLPFDWVESINENVEEVWCPSTYNETVFKNSGVKVPIKVFPHVFLQKELPNRDRVCLKSYSNDSSIRENKHYTFYNISELNPRKGVEDLITTFCEAFTSKDKVRLILKVHYKNYEENNKKHCISRLSELVSQYKNAPKIHFILNNMTESEILGLHAIGDCYVSLCKSEGFGLTIFEAFKYGKRVITTGYGGQVDFLGKDYEGLVQYKLGNIPKEMKEFSKYYSVDQQWAYPVLDHAKNLMMEAIK